ncbi:hypothetical protein MTR_6g079610 [Medicago truncatula]|uniref:Uncharacterized protein n=1 Tax=Medicago truncatula TaxID=3880 RepID=A0A072UBW4_MEDTR|nr:hypothetical protein MTR_6g079610 [Medicago truncatula]
MDLTYVNSTAIDLYIQEVYSLRFELSTKRCSDKLSSVMQLQSFSFVSYDSNDLTRKRHSTQGDGILNDAARSKILKKESRIEKIEGIANRNMLLFHDALKVGQTLQKVK